MVFVGISMIRKWWHIVFILTLFLGGCWHKQADEQEKTSQLAQITQRKKLKVTILNNSTSYFLYRGTPMGFHYELVTAYARHLGVEVTLDIAKDYPSALKKVQDGECDVLASSVNITGRRKKKMLFTTPIFRSNPVLVQNKNSNLQYIEDWLDVDTLRVAITATHTNQRIVQNLREDLGLNIEVTELSDIDQEELIDQVAENLQPATFADKIIAQTSQTYYPDLDISISAGLTRNMAWVTNSKSKELVKSINDWLADFRKTADYKTLFIKYFKNRKSVLRNKMGYELSAKQLSVYDAVIKKEAKEMQWDWRLLSALIYTESRFDSTQVSWSGAFGVMQLMPRTAKILGISKQSSVAEQMKAGRKLLQLLEVQFSKTMQDKTDLKLFVLAAYNSGAGHILDARRLAEKYGKNKDNWAEVAPYILHLKEPKYYKDEVVKRGYFRGKETVNHVKKITKLYEHYKVLFPKE